MIIQRWQIKLILLCNTHKGKARITQNFLCINIADLFVIIEKSKKALINGGHLVWNISDVYMHHQVKEICHPMITYAESIGLKLTAVYGMKMAKRVNSKSSQNGVFCEPIYVFEK